MSTELGTIRSEISDVFVLEFFGGEEVGMCIQLSQPTGGYVQLTLNDAVTLCKVLAEKFIEPHRLRLVADYEKYDLRGLADVVRGIKQACIPAWARSSEFIQEDSDKEEK